MINKKRTTLLFVLALLLLSSHLIFAKAQDAIAILPMAKTSQLPASDKIISRTLADEESTNTGQPQGMDGAWLIYNDQWRYQYVDGSYLYSTWATIGKSKYHFDDKGIMQIGWINLDNVWYYLSDQGALQTGWLPLTEGLYYLDANGAMNVGWVEVDGASYYLNESGIMQTGWQDINGVTYYFDENGKLTTGWVSDSNGTYYLKSDSSKTTGWLHLDDKYYYFNGDGIMQTGWLSLDGKLYFMKDNGEWDSSMSSNSNSGQMVALTFDDGPGKYTDRLLDALAKYNAKATFFMLGSNIPSYPDTVKRMDSLGCEIGNHTNDHVYLTKQDAAGIKAQIDTTNQKLNAILGKNATLVRPPYGSYNDTVLQNLGAPAILWSIDTLDWQTLNADSTVKTVMENVKDGDIILMHDIHSTSVDAAEVLIPALQARGFQLVTVSELAAAKGKTLENGKSYGSFH